MFTVRYSFSLPVFFLYICIIFFFSKHLSSQTEKACLVSSTTYFLFASASNQKNTISYLLGPIPSSYLAAAHHYHRSKFKVTHYYHHYHFYSVFFSFFCSSLNKLTSLFFHFKHNSLSSYILFLKHLQFKMMSVEHTKKSSSLFTTECLSNFNSLRQYTTTAIQY